MAAETAKEYTSKDFLSNIDAKWCPGCGCFPILKGITGAFTDLGVPKEKLAVISGIGCSSRFPYYVNTFGFHTIHGRAPTIATGLKLARPDLSVWIVSGDGDCLSIGGNHFIHTMRRNPDVNYLLFNNEIYGLTKGQASPTSKPGTLSKTTPYGSVDNPMDAIPMAIAAGATFAARVVDSDLKMMKDIFAKAHAHKGTSFVEIMFNCVTFADKAFEDYSSKQKRPENTMFLEAGKPITFGPNNEKGIRMNGYKPEVVEVGQNGVTVDDLLVHDPADPYLGNILSRMNAPRALGVIRQVEGPSYGEIVRDQAAQVRQKKGQGDLQSLLTGTDSWEVK